MSIIVGIYGPPAVGKSTVAKKVAAFIGAKVRHCGEIVKAHARELGTTLDDVPLEVHRKIDAETRQVAETTREPLILEGRFLDEVLRGIPRVLLISLECNLEERIRRHVSRGGSSISLREQDVWTEGFRRRAYSLHPNSEVTSVTISTDGLDADTVAKSVYEEIQRNSTDDSF